jgi:hypothetical protein
MSAELDAALARTKLFEQQLKEALALRYGDKGVTPMTTPTNNQNNDAVDDIVAPFTLCAENVVERVDKDTGAIVYEVENAGKVLFSTVTRPLAFAFVAGVNAVPTPKKAAPAKEGAGGKPESASIQSSVDALGDDKSPGATPPAPKPEPRKRAVL